MNKRDKLLKKLSKDVKTIENEIKHRKIYNIRNFVVRTLLQSGIAIDYALPFILTSIVISQIYTSRFSSPFSFDEIIEKANIETIDTSSGFHQEKVSYDFSYNKELIEYSTGWHKNDKGLFERTVTSYRISDEIDLSKTEEILSMSKEEIENILVITNVQTICKNTLTKDDDIYTQDALIIINYKESENEFRTRQETLAENIGNSIYFIILSLLWGNCVRSIENVFIKTYIRDNLRRYKSLFRRINKEELNTMKKILEIKKKNLELIDEKFNNNKEEINEKQHTLIKYRGTKHE